MSGVTREDIVLAYRLLLDRMPESEDAIKGKLRHKSKDDLVRELVCSREFATRNRVHLRKYFGD
jgi:hypothetical protein